MSAKPKMGAIRTHSPKPHGFADNLGNIRAAFPDYPDKFSWRLRKGKRLASVESDDPAADAALFASLASEGFISEVTNDIGYRRELADGTIIGLRIMTSSGGSPAVDLNIIGENHVRKIHFYRKENI